MSEARRATTRDALRLKAGAARKRAVAVDLADDDPLGARFERSEATDMDVRADSMLTLKTPLHVGNGGELELLPDAARDLPGLVDTVRGNPDRVTAGASVDRLNLAADAGALDMAVDATETIQARNSMEKMLAHEIAAAHALAMRLTAKSTEFLGHVTSWNGPERQQLQSIEAARMATAAARLMESFQRGLLTLDRLRRGGCQVVTVQHVSVSDGGQAVVAGTVATGHAGTVRRRGARRK